MISASVTVPGPSTFQPFARMLFLSLRLFLDLDAIIRGCCCAWKRLVAEPGRVASLTDYPYLRSVRTP